MSPKFQQAIHTQLKIGVLDYCGVEDPRLDILYGSMEDDNAVAKILADIRHLASEF